MCMADFSNCVGCDGRKHWQESLMIHTTCPIPLYIDSMHDAWTYHKLVPSITNSVLSLNFTNGLRSKALHHGRSLSFPSSSHPALSHFDDNLVQVDIFRGCSSLSSINATINGLRNLYESIDGLLLLPHIQHIISVDDCIRLLDGCSRVKDIISLAKQDLRELLSAVRRKDAHGINAYLASRRKLKKKSLKSLRRGASANVSMLKDAKAAAISLLESLLSYALGTKMQERKSRLVISIKADAVQESIRQRE